MDKRERVRLVDALTSLLADERGKSARLEAALAEGEPSDAEVEAAAVAMWQESRSSTYNDILGDEGAGPCGWEDESEGGKIIARGMARAALRAARKARMG